MTSVTAAAAAADDDDDDEDVIIGLRLTIATCDHLCCV